MSQLIPDPNAGFSGGNFTLLAYVAIVFLAAVMAITNVHSEFKRFEEHPNHSRMYSAVFLSLLASVFIILIAGKIVSQVILSETVLQGNPSVEGRIIMRNRPLVKPGRSSAPPKDLSLVPDSQAE